VIPLAWVAAAVAATMALPQLGSDDGGSMDDLVPSDSEAARPAAVAAEEFGATNREVTGSNPVGPVGCRRPCGSGDLID